MPGSTRLKLSSRPAAEAEAAAAAAAKNEGYEGFFLLSWLLQLESESAEERTACGYPRRTEPPTLLFLAEKKKALVKAAFLSALARPLPADPMRKRRPMPNWLLHQRYYCSST